MWFEFAHTEILALQQPIGLRFTDNYNDGFLRLSGAHSSR